MAVVAIPYNDPWIVARWAFKRLLDRTSARLDADEDKELLMQAQALDGLHFDALGVLQARRIAVAMGTSADELRLELSGEGGLVDSRDAEFVDALDVLSMRLHDLYE